MTRCIVLGNGSLTVLYDCNYEIRELYYPLFTDNHAEKLSVGLYKEGKFRWIRDLNPSISYVPNTLSSLADFKFDNTRVLIKDSVDMASNVLIRKISVDTDKELLLFFTLNLSIYGNNIGDTALYDPSTSSIIHYKRERWFMFTCDVPFYEYATGYKETKGLLGTWKDCEDGKLSMNPIAQGSVDSAVSIKVNGSKTFYCWLIAGKSYNDVKKINEYVKYRTPEYLLKRTEDYWKAWLYKARKYNDNVKRSLLTIVAHWQYNGALPASLDTDIIKFNRDTYNYVWHRDAAFSVIAMSLLGYAEQPRQFFKFTLPLIQNYGFLFQKYTADGHWGSTWHSWTSGYIPIQEDETALTLYALWVYFKKFEDVDFIKPLYSPIIKAAANFLISYYDKELNLPLPSYDLWEERLGVHIFTSSAVYIALLSAADFANFFGDLDLSKTYASIAKKLRDSVVNNFYVNDHFVRTLMTEKGKVINKDSTVDASSLFVTLFGLLKPDDPIAIKNREVVENTLLVDGGIIRYENDYYLREENQKPNRWYITTLWLAQHYAYEGKEDKAYEYLEWVLRNSLKTGIIPEQISPTGKYPSVAPLVWSHAELIKTYYILENGFEELIPPQPLA